MSPSIVLGFTGAYRDAAAFAYPLGSGYRWYLPWLMRFNAPDSYSPFGNGGVHPYAYCGADPVNDVDPTGHISSEHGLTALETWEAVFGMEAREGRRDLLPESAAVPSREPHAHSQRNVQPSVTHVAPAPGAPVGAVAIHHDPSSGSIGARQAIGAATSTPAESVPRARPGTDPAPGAIRNLTFKQLLRVAVPEFIGRRKAIRARASGVVTQLRKAYPGKIKPITELPGYDQSAFTEYLGVPGYQSLWEFLRGNTSSSTSAGASAEWKSFAPYFGVDL